MTPFVDQAAGEKSKRKQSSLLERRVYLMNVPYDATKAELVALVKEFAPIEDIVVPRDR